MKIFISFFFISFCFAQQKTVDYLFQNPSLNTEAFVVLKKNKLVFSKYTKGDISTKHLVWSITKSITSLLFGIAEDRNYLRMDQKVCDILSCDYKLLKNQHILNMTSGLGWKEIYDSNPFNSHVVRMLYLEMNRGMIPYILKTPEDKRPGDFFSYSSADTNLVMGVLNKVLPTDLKSNFPWSFLFDPLGIKNAVFEKDGKGVFVGSSYAYLSVEDLIKIAMLLINNGSYNGKKIISKRYLSFATSINPASSKKCNSKNQSLTYGAQFWLNEKCEGRTPLPDVPNDAFAMLGYGGQSVFIIPSKELIVVRIGNDTKKRIDLNKYLSFAIEEFK